MPASKKGFELLMPVMDADSALQRLGDDIELMEQIMQIFLEDAPRLVHTAREAIAHGDLIELRRAAHSLKGMMATLSAREGANAAFRLEQCAAAGDSAGASPLVLECGEQVAGISRALEAYCNRDGMGRHNSTATSGS